MIICAVISGVIPSANIEKFSKEPPVNAEKRFNASFEFAAIHCLKIVASTPGTGIIETTRVKKIMRTISSSLCLISREVNAFIKKFSFSI